MELSIVLVPLDGDQSWWDCKNNLGKVSIKKKLKVMEFSILGGGGLADFHNFFGEKKCFFHKKYKYDQNGLIHPEKWRL